MGEISFFKIGTLIHYFDKEKLRPDTGYVENVTININKEDSSANIKYFLKSKASTPLVVKGDNAFSSLEDLKNSIVKSFELID